MKAAIPELTTILKQSLMSDISIFKVENQLNKPDDTKHQVNIEKFYKPNEQNHYQLKGF